MSLENRLKFISRAFFGGLTMENPSFKKGGAKDGFFLGRNSRFSQNILEQAF
ncbi:hypothetical protein SBF1_3600004 [Candidatus Desulfosporosinus infrequens]|uniref:Uncharacterized protein n=1 Tax=Candidatus Desulfosporosinus infrequens TaxID=2043169 RepID=A0A2U3L3D1_9FIRM|nr:hypothetical protein SBF1_3600004 [Candidatus Desulfosporosinus infrequens]